MLSIRESATHLLIAGDVGELDAIDEWFAFRPSGYYYAPSYQRWRVSEGQEGWDGWLHPFKRVHDNLGRILRGHRFELLSMLDTHDMRYNGDKLLPAPFSLEAQDVPANVIEAPFELDIHQREGVAYWLNHAIGISRVTVSGGKTAMFAAAAALLKQKFPKARILYVTQAERLVRQATKEMKRFLPELDIGQYGGGVLTGKIAKDMCICTIAMLHKNFYKLKDGWFDSFMCLFYDEVHHCASKTSKQIVLQIPAFFRFGASDTTKSEDQAKSTDIRGLFGPIVVDVAAKPLIDKGRIARPFIYIVDRLSWNNRFKEVTHAPAARTTAFVLLDGQWMKGTYCGPVYETNEDGSVKTRMVKGTKKEEDTGDWEMLEQPVITTGLHRVELQGTEMDIDARWVLLDRLYDRCIVQFKERNEAIVEWVKHFSSQELPTLVVCTRTLHILILEAMIGQAVGAEKVRILMGEDSPTKRDATFEWFRQSQGGVLISPLVKEGVSINEIRAGVIADYIADWEVANQVIGRFIRKKEGEENFAEIVWFVDRQHPTLRQGCQELMVKLARFEAYVLATRNRPADKPVVRPAAKPRRPFPAQAGLP